MKKSCFLYCIIFVSLMGCKEEKLISSQDSELPKAVEIPITKTETLSFDPLLLPKEKAMPVELYVENSDPVHPGSKIDIIDNSSSPPQAIISDITVQHVRWKTKGPFIVPEFPASGFVMVMLTKSQYLKIHNRDIVIKLSEINPTTNDKGDSD